MPLGFVGATGILLKMKENLGMFHEPGTKGPDKGVDGVLKFYSFTDPTLPPEPLYAIIQVKGGRVTPDSVRALDSTVRQYDMKAGIMICFEDQMRTVDNNRSKETFSDSSGRYPVIQGLSVEDLLQNVQPDLPLIAKMTEFEKEGLKNLSQYRMEVD